MAYGTVNADVIGTSVAGSNLGAGNATNFKNRIINGAMVIDQRNAGASVTPINAQYLVDRWFVDLTQSSKFTAQQNAGSVTPPAGFINYLGTTSSSAYSVTSTDYFLFSQQIQQKLRTLTFSKMAIQQKLQQYMAATILGTVLLEFQQSKKDSKYKPLNRERIKSAIQLLVKSK